MTTKEQKLRDELTVARRRLRRATNIIRRAKNELSRFDHETGPGFGSVWRLDDAMTLFLREGGGK